MKVLLKPHSNKVFTKNNIFKINNGDNIFYGLKKKLKQENIEINTLDLDKNGDFEKIIFLDIPLPWEIKYWKYLLLNKNKSTLFTFESPLVSPLSHRKPLHLLFSSVYTWNDSLVDTQKIHKFNLPSLNTRLKSKRISYKNKKLLCLINSNKSFPLPFILASPFKHDLYKERIKAISFFENEIPENFSLYGRGWNEPKKFSIKENLFGHKIFKSYKGEIPRNANAKLKTLSKYKFNLCFENCIAPGYISEKIIDCFKVGTIPIYYGAPNITDYIPKSCFIDFRDFDDYQSLLVFMESMSEKKYNQYVNNASKLIKSKKFKSKWFEESFEKTLIKALS